MVWRIGVALLEIPQLPACVGVAPQGLNLGSVQPLPQLILGPLRDCTCLVKCLRGLVRAAVPAPNAPSGVVLRGLLHVDDGVLRVNTITW